MGGGHVPLQLTNNVAVGWHRLLRPQNQSTQRSRQKRKGMLSRAYSTSALAMRLDRKVPGRWAVMSIDSRVNEFCWCWCQVIGNNMRRELGASVVSRGRRKQWWRRWKFPGSLQTYDMIQYAKTREQLWRTFSSSMSHLDSRCSDTPFKHVYHVAAADLDSWGATTKGNWEWRGENKVVDDMVVNIGCCCPVAAVSGHHHQVTRVKLRLLEQR